jgi:GNAT superfamily N-acetyltransferase
MPTLEPQSPKIALSLLDPGEPLAAELAARHAGEWAHLYPGWDAEAALRDFRRHRTDGSLPATLVLREGGEFAGSVSVLFGDCEARRDLDPWLASLHVMPGHRGRGHARRLVLAAVDLAARNNVEVLHVFTEGAEGLFEKCGFVRFADADLHGHAVRILRRKITLHSNEACKLV